MSSVSANYVSIGHRRRKSRLTLIIKRDPLRFTSALDAIEGDTTIIPKYPCNNDATTRKVLINSELDPVYRQ